MSLIVPIVEGQGEQEAVPALLHRLNAQMGGGSILKVNPPIRVKLGSFLNDRKYFDRYVALAAAKARSNSGLVLILLDCDYGCPAKFGPMLLQQAKLVANDVNCLVCLAYQEFETWFVAASVSLRGKFSLPQDLEPPPILAMRDAKGWLGKRMSSGYDPVVHQLKFVKAFDLEQARSAQSFNRLCERFSGFLQRNVEINL